MINLAAILANEEVKKKFSEAFFEGYLKPAFGSKSKTEIDILVFTSLISAGALDPVAPIYDIARSLNITPSRVRTLLLTWQLRSSNTNLNLKIELINALKKTRFAKDNNYLAFGIESPLLREEIIAQLKQKGFYADTTFSREIIRLPIDGFIEFIKMYIDIEAFEKVQQKLVADKLLPESSFKALAKAVLVKIAEKGAGKIGSAMMGTAFDGMTDAMESFEVTQFLAALLNGDVKIAAKIAKDVLKEPLKERESE